VWTQDAAEAELAKALLKIEPDRPKGRRYHAGAGG
jgi:hypothetical protein